MNQFTTENAALILVDHQVGTINWAGSLRPEQRDEVKMWTLVIAKFAKAAKMPIVLTSSLETEAQGPLLPELQEILPDEYAARVKRTGVINAWEDPAFANAVRDTKRKNLLMAGLTTDVCLVPPALSARSEGFNVITLLDASAACTKTAEENSRQLLLAAGIPSMTVIPTITSLLGNYKNPASAGFFEAMDRFQVYQLLGRGDVR